MKEFLTVAEAAQELNISKQAVYNRLEKDLKPYLKTLNGQKMISSKAIKSISVEKPEEIQDEASRLRQDTIEALKHTIEILEKQLDTKDKQIDLLNDRLQEASQRLSEVNSIAFRQIEALPAQAPDEDKAEAHPVEVTDHELVVTKDYESNKSGFFKKLFRKERSW